VPRAIHRLTARAVASASKPGKLGDGGGLCLQVAKGGSKSWVFRFMAAGHEHEMGLGPYPAISLAQARQKAADVRTQRATGIDPLAAKRSQRASLALANVKSQTFAQCVAAYIASHEAGWGNREHRRQWDATLQAYALPLIGALSVHGIDTGLVMRVLEPIWATKAETAGRVRGRIEVVLDWAKVRGYREGENPARWKGHLEHLLPPRSVVQPVKHHAALPYARLPEFMGALREQQGVAVGALEFLILTAARMGEVMAATWSEIDLAGKVWAIPRERMKAGKEHRVPLGDRALAILNALPREGVFIFPGAWKHGKPISKMAMPDLLERVGYAEATVHGFRSTFRDWAAECTDFPAT